MGKTNLGIVAIALVAIVGLGVAGYTTLTPHSATVTQQRYLTNTQNFYTTQTQTLTSTSTVTSSVATNAAVNLNGGGPAYYQTCGYYGCYPAQGYSYTPCASTGTGNTVTCYSYLIQNGLGCVQVSVPTTDPDYWRSGIWYVHYTLQHLPSSYPSIGSWVDVTGQLNISSTSISANSASCSPNTIGVTSITPTSAPQP
jgi:hypothetical protein